MNPTCNAQKAKSVIPFANQIENCICLKMYIFDTEKRQKHDVTLGHGASQSLYS